MRTFEEDAMKTKRKLALPALFMVLLFLVPALTIYGLLKAPSGWSVEENRALAENRRRGGKAVRARDNSRGGGGYEL